MATIQRYVSKELTHFVAAAKKTPEEQYEVLTQILRSGWLTTTPNAPGSPKPLQLFSGRKISLNRMYYSGAICFCDIPVEDLGIHIAKYSPFGISFLKSFLLPKGVNPVFYIANESVLGKAVAPDTGEVTGEDITRGEYLDDMSKGIYYRFVEGVQLRARTDLPPVVRQYLERYRMVDMFCVYQVLAYMKPFHAIKEDADRDNFYMEREWRSPGDVQFAPGDVWRIILPRKFVSDFRRDFPSYEGQLTYAPDDIVPAPPDAGVGIGDEHDIGITMTIPLVPAGSAEQPEPTMTLGPMRRKAAVPVEPKETDPDVKA